MALLFVEHLGHTRGARLPSRVLIGRRSMNHLIIDDPTVSRMHAWIDRRGDDYVLTDMRSRTGTRVNGTPLAKRRKLAAGDVIEIGPARLTFQPGESVPLDIETFDLSREPVMLARDLGIRFDCPHCRSPMWASMQYAGHGGICTYCGEGFTIPRTATNPTGGKPRAVPTESGAGSAAVAAATSADAIAGSPPAFVPHARKGTISALPKAPPLPPAYDARLLALQVAPAVATPTAAASSAHSVALAVDDPAAPGVEPGPASAVDPTPVAATSYIPQAPKIQPATLPPDSDIAGEAVAMAEPSLEGPSAEVSPQTVTGFADGPAALIDGPATPSEGIATISPVQESETAPAPLRLAKCGVCHSSIVAGEATTDCPSCGLRFHEECWQENYGCSAYGCPQVNVLAPPPDPDAEDEAQTDEATIDVAPPRTPWEFVLLGLSAVAMVVSGFSFGAASLATLIATLLYWRRHRYDSDQKTGPLVAALGLSIAGVAAGAAVSYFLFLYGT